MNCKVYIKTSGKHFNDMFYWFYGVFHGSLVCTPGKRLACQKVQDYFDSVVQSLSDRNSVSVPASQVSTLSIAWVCHARLNSSRQSSATLGLCKMWGMVSHLWIYSKTSNMHIHADADKVYMVKYGTVIIYYASMIIALRSFISISWAALDCHKKETNFQKKIFSSQN